MGVGVAGTVLERAPPWIMRERDSASRGIRAAQTSNLHTPPTLSEVRVVSARRPHANHAMESRTWSCKGTRCREASNGYSGRSSFNEAAAQHSACRREA